MRFAFDFTLYFFASQFSFWKGEEEHPAEDQNQEISKEAVDQNESVPPKSVSDGGPTVSHHGERDPSSYHGDRPPSSHHGDGPPVSHHDGKPHLIHHGQHDNHSSATLRNKVPIDAQTGKQGTL